MSAYQETNIEDHLEKIYNDVSEWLKFAEAKHAAALALWSAIIVAVMSVDLVSSMSFMCYCILLIALLLGMLLDIVSFIPFLNRNKRLGDFCYNSIKKRVGVTNNILFYQNIFLLAGSPILGIDVRLQRYKSKLKLKYHNISQDMLIDSYIEQIVSISTVATIKVFLFNIVARYILFLVFVAIVCIIIA